MQMTSGPLCKLTQRLRFTPSPLLRWLAVLTPACLVLLAAGCTPAKPAAAAGPPPPTFTVTQPVETEVQSYYEYNGYLDAVDSVQVTARVKGFLIENPFTEGEEVKQGDVLFRIDPREYNAAVKRAEADKAKAIAEFKRAEADEKRGRMLRQTNAIAEEDLQERVAARETAEAVVLQTDAAIEIAKLDREYTVLRSPINGQISRILVTRGNLVGQNENTLLTTIVSVDPLYVYFDIPERDLVEYQRSLLEHPQPAVTSGKLEFDVGVSTEEGFPHVGRIDFRENRVDTSTGTVRIRGQVPNPKVEPNGVRLLYPGLYARVRVPRGGPRLLPVISEDVLMTGQEGRFVYVLDDKNVVQKRSVTVGATVYKSPPATNGANVAEQEQTAWTVKAVKEPPVDPQANPKLPPPPTMKVVQSVVAIEKGLKATDRVLLDGLTAVRPGMAINPDEWVLRAPGNVAPKTAMASDDVHPVTQPAPAAATPN